MTLVEVLTRARQRLAGDGWRCMPMDACDKAGRWCPVEDEGAAHFSILGALLVDATGEGLVEAWDLLDSVTPGGLLMTWEEGGRTTGDVQLLFARAIARAVALNRRRGSA